MDKFAALTESINYIEAQLCEPVTREEIAQHCHTSLSSLEKLFRHALSISIKDYITRRRMTQAAKDIAKGGASVTDAAMKYQFNSVEVFSRAFKRVWGVNPSEFAAKWKFTGIYPKINYTYNEGEDFYMARKRVDISEIYDYLKSMGGSYVLCFDMRGLMAINEISHKAGDMAILEMARRIDCCAGDGMAVMRIGGDEFALITGLYNLEEAQDLMEQVLEKNGQPIDYQGQEHPVSLYCGITKAPEALKYQEFFADLHNTIAGCKE